MITLSLSRDEASFLAQQLRRHLQTVEKELIHTDVRRMQRELAADLARLNDFQAQLESQLGAESEEARASTPMAP